MDSNISSHIPSAIDLRDPEALARNTQEGKMFLHASETPLQSARPLHQDHQQQQQQQQNHANDPPQQRQSPHQQPPQQVDSLALENYSTSTRYSSQATSKSYDRAIRYFQEWALNSSAISGPNRSIVTPRRVHLFLMFVDQYKRKGNGQRYSFSFYEQQVSSLVILYEKQRRQFPQRPEIDEDRFLEASQGNNGSGAPDPTPQQSSRGQWLHPRDQNVKDFLKMIKEREHNASEAVPSPRRVPEKSRASAAADARAPLPAIGHSSSSNVDVPDPVATNRQPNSSSVALNSVSSGSFQPAIASPMPPLPESVQAGAGPVYRPNIALPNRSSAELDSRFGRIEQVLQGQAEFVNKTNTLLSLYHNDLNDRGVRILDFSRARHEQLLGEVAELKKLVEYLVDLGNKNQEMIRNLLQGAQRVDGSALGSNSVSSGSVSGSSVSATRKRPLYSTSEGANDTEYAIPQPRTPAQRSPQRHQRGSRVLPVASPHQLLPLDVADDDIPAIRLLDSRELTLSALYDEYMNGYDGQPSLRSMELRYKTRWRVKSKNNKTILRRLKVGTAIERTSKQYNQPVEEVVRELDEYLTLNLAELEGEVDSEGEDGVEGTGHKKRKYKKKKSAYWLSENLPLKFTSSLG